MAQTAGDCIGRPTLSLMPRGPRNSQLDVYQEVEESNHTEECSPSSEQSGSQQRRVVAERSRICGSKVPVTASSEQNSDACTTRYPQSLNSRPHTWQSDNAKLTAEYNRYRKLVGYIAPKQFRDPARPSDGPCNIAPTSVQEYIEHRKFMASMAQEQMQMNIEWMKQQIGLRKSEKRLESAFGKNGRVFEDGLSPVLALPTIWSIEHQQLALCSANWPAHSELHQDGRIRQQLGTKCGRFLPAPRLAEDQDIVTPPGTRRLVCALPLDETGPIYTNGAAPVDVVFANKMMNSDPAFEEQGMQLLGHGFIDELAIASWRPPRVEK